MRRKKSTFLLAKASIGKSLRDLFSWKIAYRQLKTQQTFCKLQAFRLKRPKTDSTTSRSLWIMRPSKYVFMQLQRLLYRMKVTNWQETYTKCLSGHHSLHHSCLKTSPVYTRHWVCWDSELSRRSCCEGWLCLPKRHWLIPFASSAEWRCSQPWALSSTAPASRPADRLRGRLVC